MMLAAHSCCLLGQPLPLTASAPAPRGVRDGGVRERQELGRDGEV